MPSLSSPRVINIVRCLHIWRVRLATKLLSAFSPPSHFSSATATVAVLPPATATGR